MTTSIDSYHKCHKDGIISQKQHAVLQFILDTQEQFPDGHSRGDVGRHFNDPNTGYQRRLQELEQLGILTCVGTKHDPLTNRDVKAYKPTGVVPTERAAPTVTYIVCLCTNKPTNNPCVVVFPKKDFEVYTKRLIVLEQHEVVFEYEGCPGRETK